jgi:2-succinyl-5-enolpyruvyl-6-hydroxy-3-cyclohexene-1-carboxylate synthase
MDLVIDRKVAFSNVDSNRGANGIDGQISTFLGLSEKPNQSWGFFGDLTTLYDLSSLWATPQLQKNKRRIVVINNHGGQIFKGIFKNDIFLNSHQIEFKDWAQMWKWDYLKWQSIPENILNLSAENLIIELKPDNIQSESFWQEYKI